MQHNNRSILPHPFRRRTSIKSFSASSVCTRQRSAERVFSAEISAKQRAGSGSESPREGGTWRAGESFASFATPRYRYLTIMEICDRGERFSRHFLIARGEGESAEGRERIRFSKSLSNVKLRSQPGDSRIRHGPKTLRDPFVRRDRDKSRN